MIDPTSTRGITSLYYITCQMNVRTQLKDNLRMRFQRQTESIRWGGSPAAEVPLNTSHSYNKKTIPQRNCQKSKTTNRNGDHVKIPANRTPFAAGFIRGHVTPRVWGLAPVFTVRVAVHGSNFLIKAPRPSPSPSLLPRLGTPCWALKCKSALVRIADELRPFMGFQ